jgi:hypothetical protein
MLPESANMCLKIIEMDAFAFYLKSNLPDHILGKQNTLEAMLSLSTCRHSEKKKKEKEKELRACRWRTSVGLST